MVKSRFSFAGKSSDDFYLTVEKLPVITVPGKKYSTISVPGRNGDLHIEENAFRNYTQPYECWFRAPEASAPEIAHAIKEWLLGSRGPHILQDTYDSGCFRKATYLGPMDIEQLLNGYGRCTIQFDCAPQAFLCSGEDTVKFEAAGSLWNPTAFAALPLIIVYGTGTGDLTVGGKTVKIKEIEDVLFLDCDTQNAYRRAEDGVTENKNSKIYAPVFPKLIAGENMVSWTGDIQRVEIIPRWWTI